MNYNILVPILLSAIVGSGFLFSSLLDHIKADDKNVLSYRPQEKRIYFIGMIALVLSVAVALYVAWLGSPKLVLFEFIDKMPVYFQIDSTGKLFATITSIVWLLVFFYSYKYMNHEGEEKRFIGCYLLVYSVLICLEFAGNMITFYLFYELMTLTSVPFVLHNRSKESIMAALKYLFYSLIGAYCALFGIYILYQNCDSFTFTPGGTLNLLAAGENRGLLLLAVFLMLVGFGTKAGMLPFHAWLPTAHPVAPSPASAVLSSIIVKGGVLAVIRTVFYIVGPEFIRGTWVQTVWLIITLVTIFMGSLLAYREKVFKKRLAYSTVSQLSYILFGIALLNPTALTGSLIHVVAHALIKSALFLTAGTFIYRTGCTRVEEYAGIGKKMNLTLWGYTLASLGLIGIPLTGGYISKWYLAVGSLESGLQVIGVLGPVVLLVSALLTAGYLLPVTMKGFLPGKDSAVVPQKEKKDIMTIVVVILAGMSVVIGMFPNPLIRFAENIAQILL